MTYEEAYGYLKKLMGCATRTGSEECLYKEYCDNCEYDYDSDKWEDAIATAREALEKQIPKNLATNGENFGGKLYKFCPSCGACMGLTPKASYCSECGQSISWTHENDSEVD